MRPRTVVIILLLAIGLGAYAYYVERPARLRESEKQTLLSFDSDAVEEVTLTYPKREIRLKKDPDGHWRMTAPIEVDADQSAVENLVGAIARAELTRTIEEPSGNLGAYGLDEPTVKVRLRLADGTHTPTLAVGKQTPIGFKAYVQKEDDPNVYLTTGSFHAGVKREAKDLRNKIVIDFTDDEVKTITLARKARNPLVLSKADDSWKITEPAEYIAEAAEVRSFLSSLRGIRAQDFVDDPSEGLATYGLDPPRLRVSLSLGETAAGKSILLGTEAAGPSKQIYAKRDDRETVYVIGEWVFKNLDRDLVKFRDRTVLPFERDQAIQITIARRDGDPLTLERTTDHPWTVQGSTSPTKESALKSFVDDLRQTKATEIVSDDIADFPTHGLDDPELRISVVDQHGEEIGTLLATRRAGGEEGTDEFYFAREGMPTIFKGSRYLFNRLDKRVQDFLEEPNDPSADQEPS